MLITWRILIIIFLVGIGSVSGADEPQFIGSAKQLLFDDKIIDRTFGVVRTVNPPEYLGAVMEPEHPWESYCLSYFNVLEDEGLFRMWYGAYEAPDMTRRICYAISTDGLVWRRPNLGLVTYAGSSANNILPVDFDDGGALFIDPLAPADSRYKLLGNRTYPYIYESADGLNFQLVDTALLDLMADTHNEMFYDDRIGAYVAYLRSWNFIEEYDGGARPNRTVSRIELMNPTEPWPYLPLDSPFFRFGPDRPPAISTELDIVVAPDTGDPPDIDIYNPCVNKYSEAPDAYFAFPSIFHYYPPPPEGQFHSDGVLNIQLAVSRDGIEFTRFRTPYIDFGVSEDSLQQIYMALGMLRVDGYYYQYLMGYRETHGNPIQNGKYYGFRQRVDGFVSLDTDGDQGELQTCPLRFEGNCLTLNYVVDGPGFLLVELQKCDGTPIEGFGLAESDTLRGDDLTGVVSFRDRKYLGNFRDRPIRLHLVMQEAKLFALQFVFDPELEPPPMTMLEQNCPNPFRSETEISFSLPKPAWVVIDIFNVLGQRVITLVDRRFEGGPGRVTWDGRDHRGSQVSAGVYLYRLRAGGSVETKKMILLK